jgi:hypothetical protein
MVHISIIPQNRANEQTYVLIFEHQLQDAFNNGLTADALNKHGRVIHLHVRTACTHSTILHEKVSPLVHKRNKHGKSVSHPSYP